MSDAIISRRGGGVLQQTATPSILDFSTASPTSIKFKLRNNDSVAATLVYRFGTLTGDGESISVAASTTTGEITSTVPTITAATSLFVTANATGKVKSEVAEQEFTAPLVYTAATGGTTLEYNLDGKRYKSHTFNSNGTFEVTTVGDVAGDRNQVDYLIIGGGGGGSRTVFDTGNGGGAGGYRTTFGQQGGGETLDTKPNITATTYAVTIGSGGTGTTVPGGNGVNSSVAFDTTITANGGEGGPQGNFSGGAAGQGIFGFLGGAKLHSSVSGGGGGAGQHGSDSAPGVSGKGGDGLGNILRIGSNQTRGGGGGGGAQGSGNLGGPGGAGGGGSASNGGITKVGGSGTVNTGGGGASGSTQGIQGNPITSADGGAGGSGIVVIRYEIETV